jgi:hypothetical protein
MGEYAPLEQEFKESKIIHNIDFFTISSLPERRG